MRPYPDCATPGPPRPAGADPRLKLMPHPAGLPLGQNLTIASVARPCPGKTGTFPYFRKTAVYGNS